MKKNNRIGNNLILAKLAKIHLYSLAKRLAVSYIIYTVEAVVFSSSFIK